MFDLWIFAWNIWKLTFGKLNPHLWRRLLKCQMWWTSPASTDFINTEGEPLRWSWMINSVDFSSSRNRVVSLAPFLLAVLGRGGRDFLWVCRISCWQLCFGLLLITPGCPSPPHLSAPRNVSMGLTSLFLSLPSHFPPLDPQWCPSLQDLLYFILWSLKNTQSAEKVIGESAIYWFDWNSQWLY